MDITITTETSLRKCFKIVITTCTEVKFIKKFLHAMCENCHGKKRLRFTKGLYIVNHKGKVHGKQSLIPCIKHDNQFCILPSVVLTQVRKSVGVSGFVQVQQGRRDKTLIASSKTIALL